MKSILLTTGGFEDEGDHEPGKGGEREGEGSLQMTRMITSCQLSMKWEPQPYHPIEINSDNNVKEPGSGFLLRAYDK